jgi:hypothetical protein
VQQRFHFHTEGLFDPQRHFGRQRRIAVDQVGEGGTAHVERLCCCGHRQTEFLEDLVADERAWMGRGHSYSGRGAAHQ